MAFLTLLGITIPTAASSSGAIEPVRSGSYSRTYAHKPVSGVHAEAPEYRASTPLMDRSTSIAYRLLVEGEGQAFAFDSLEIISPDYYSTKGKGPSGVVGTVATASTGGPVGNGGQLQLTLGATLTYALTASPLNEATLCFWYSPDGAGWTHWVLEYSGAGAVPVDQWENGATAVSYPVVAQITVSTTALTLLFDATVADAYFAEVLVLPFRASLLRADFADYLYNSGDGRTAEDLPYLTMGGTWPDSGADSVLGEVVGQSLVDTTVGGSTVQHESFEFLLRSREVR